MKVSVVIPVYNMARYLPACLDSVLGQEGVEAEAVVVDDGSTDDIQAVIAPYAGRVTYLRTPHQGLPSALNAGVEVSGGDAIAFTDADDLLLPQSLLLRARVLQQLPGVGLVFGPALVLDESGRTAGLRKAAPRPGLLPSAQAFRWLLRGCRIPNSTVMARREALADAGPFRQEAFPGEDWHMWLRIASRCDLYCLERPVACYRLHPGSITARYWVEEVDRSHRFTLADVFAHVAPEQRGLESLARCYLERTLAALAARSGRRRDFLRYLAGALGRRPLLLLEMETWGCLAVGARSLLPAPVLQGLKRVKAPLARRRLRYAFADDSSETVRAAER